MSDARGTATTNGAPEGYTCWTCGEREASVPYYGAHICTECQQTYEDQILEARRNGTGPVEAPPLEFVPAEEFAATEEEGAAAIVGTEDQALVPENGDIMVFGDGGSSKTTLTIDLAWHLAAGDDWLGLSVPRPAQVLMIENEGPRPFFRRKLERKFAEWRGSPLEGRVRVLDVPWGKFTFADDELAAALAAEVRDHEADVLIVGPLTRVGMDEAGTLQQVGDFVVLINRVRELSGRRLAVIIVHHENRAGTVSGAWEGAGDTLLHMRQAGHGKTVMHIQKARHASELHGKTVTLLWAPGESYIVEEPEERDVPAEMEQLLVDGRPRTVPEMAAPKDAPEPGIGRNLDDIRKVAKEDSRFRLLTADEVRQARPGTAPNTKLYSLTRLSSQPSQQVTFEGVGEGADSLTHPLRGVSRSQVSDPQHPSADSALKSASSTTPNPKED